MAIHCRAVKNSLRGTDVMKDEKEEKDVMRMRRKKIRRLKMLRFLMLMRRKM
jgi:hypothetical protein